MKKRLTRYIAVGLIFIMVISTNSYTFAMGDGADEPTVDITQKISISIEGCVDTVSGKPQLTWDVVNGAESYVIYRMAYKDSDYTLIDTVKETGFSDASAIAGNRYTYKITALDKQGSGELFDYSNTVSLVCRLAKPAVTGGNVASTGNPKLTWKNINEADAYAIYRSTKRNSGYKQIDTVTKASYIDKNAKRSKTYYYKVKAICTELSAANSVYSDVVERTCDLPRPEVKAGNIAKTGKIKLTWTKIRGAEKYAIYRASSLHGTYKKIYTTTKTSFTNLNVKAGKRYYYKVKAIDADKSAANSAFSEIVSRSCDLSRPVVAIEVTAKANPKLSWKKVSGAEKYEIYRSSKKNGTYQKIGSTKRLYYIDRPSKRSRTYYYKVKAIDADNAGANSARSLRCSTYVYDLDKKLIALTFDDGPGPYTQSIVNCLKKNNAHATFFVLGSRVDWYPDTIRSMYKNGNEIGNHSYSHPMLYDLDSSEIKSQMRKTDNKVKAVTGQKTVIMRPPGGAINSTVKNAVGKPLIMWSVDTLDWKTRSTPETVNCVLDNAEDGAIVLMHDIHELTKEAALQLIPKLKKQGYELVTVSELAKFKGTKLKNGSVYYSF